MNEDGMTMEQWAKHNGYIGKNTQGIWDTLKLINQNLGVIAAFCKATAEKEGLKLWEEKEDPGSGPQ